VYYGDGLLLEAVDTAGGLGTYFDGSTVLAGYTNTWAGTQQQSASYQVAGDPPAPPAPAAIAYRATATSKLETAATSLSVAYPAGIQPGDVVVLWLYVTVNTATVTVPAGWNAGRDIRSFGPTEEISNQAKAAVYWHLVDGTEGASTTWGFSTAARAIVIKTAYSGVNPDLPLGRVRIIEPGGTGTAITLDTTHAVSNAWRLSVGMARKTTDPGATFTIDAAGDAERSDETTVGGTSGSRPSLAVYDSNGTLPQGSSSRTITVSAAPTSASQAAWAAELISRQQTGAGPIAFRGASSVQTNASSTVNATVDSSFVQDGDLILAFVNRVQVGGSTTMPSGFSPVQRYLTPGSADTEVYFKIASGEPSTLTWTLTGSGSIYVSVGLVAYSGVNTSSPIGAWGTSENSGVSSTAHLSPTITTRSAESWVVNAITYAGTHSTTNADPLDAERVDAAAGSHPALAIYDSNRAYPVGSTVNRTLTSSSAATGPVLWAFEIQPGVISSEPEASVDFKRRESGVWVPHTAVPKVRVAGAWQEIQPAYWDGDSWVNLP
jgi:hypothetical protein